MNQGEYMNNYKILDDENTLNKIVEKLSKLKELFFGDALFKFSNFELDEIKRVTAIVDKLKSFKDYDNKNNNDEIIINKFIFNKLDYDRFSKCLDNYLRDSKSLNFALKSLTLQKKKMLNEFKLPEVVKISENLNETQKKLDVVNDNILNFKKELVNEELIFFEKYIEFLNDISKNTIVKSRKKLIEDKINSNMIDYFKMNKFIYFIKIIKDESIDKYIELIKEDKELKAFFGERFSDLINGLMYVGANN